MKVMNKKVTENYPKGCGDKTEKGKPIIYAQNGDCHVRYVLQGGAIGDNPLICIGINPSKPENNDGGGMVTAIERVLRNSQGKYDSWVLLNVYPEYAVKTVELPDDYNVKLVDENYQQIENILKTIAEKTNGHLTVWAAWGVSVGKKQYLPKLLRDVIDLFKRYKCSWITCGEETKERHPRYPVSTCGGCVLKKFEIDRYLSIIKNLESKRNR